MDAPDTQLGSNRAANAGNRSAGIQLWREELLAYFEQAIINGYAEGVINKIKVIKRRAYGRPTFNGFRQRVLVARG